VRRSISAFRELRELEDAENGTVIQYADTAQDPRGKRLMDVSGFHVRRLLA